MSDLRGSRILGNIVYWDTHRKRLVDAIGEDVIKYLNDFVGRPVDLTSGEYDPEWTITRVEAGAGESTFGPVAGVGGIGRITTDANEDDGINAQLRLASFKLALGNVLYFGCRAKVSDATQSDVFMGLAVIDTDILGGIADAIGFVKRDGVTALKATLTKGSAETLSGSLLVLDTSYHTYEFFLEADGTVEFFIDGASVWSGMSLANLPNDTEQRLTLQFLAGAAAVKTMDIDWLRCIQIGGRP